MRILVTGADMRNKGGQSMLFITIDQLRRKFPDAEIFFPTDKKTDEQFNITPVYYSIDSLLYAHGGLLRAKSLLKLFAKKILHKKTYTLKQLKALSRLYDSLNMVVDISGYNLSSDWNKMINFKYLEYIRQAKKRDIPVYLMPQSFGPYDYKTNKAQMLKEIQDALSYCKVVYVREKEGIDQLNKHFVLNNTVYSIDLVLQNKDLDLHNVFSPVPNITAVSIQPDSVAIVPNMKTFEHGDSSKLTALYKDIIDYLLEKNKNVYLIRHSSEDLSACKRLKEMFADNEHVILLSQDFNCIEFSDLIKQFDILIGSRYHSIIHALKRGVPCIALGWAVKYQELMELFGLKDYIFDARGDINTHELIAQIGLMNSMRKEISDKINNKLESYQKDNCFDIIA